MKVKDIDFSAYEYKRICVRDANNTSYPPDSEDIVVKLHGESEVKEVSVSDFGWLNIDLVVAQSDA